LVIIDVFIFSKITQKPNKFTANVQLQSKSNVFVNIFEVEIELEVEVEKFISYLCAIKKTHE